MALALRRVNPADVPSSAASSAATPSHTSAVNLKKRKEPSSASGSTAAQSSQTESVENPAEDEAMEEEVRDELIVSMATQVVGIQYYRGEFDPFVYNYSLTYQPGLVGNGEEVIITVRKAHNLWLIPQTHSVTQREPTNQYDRYFIFLNLALYHLNLTMLVTAMPSELIT